MQTDSAAISFLDGLWCALADATNNPHHPDEPGPRIRVREARAVLLVTVTALEYVQPIIGTER